MTKRATLICGLFVLILFQTGAFAHRSQTTATRPRRIAVFGSSVANGTGDETGKEGYTGLLRQLWAGRGWEVLNQSRGGDTTKTMAPRFAPAGTPDPNTRYLLPVHPGYVVIGLSLANEGIWEAKTKQEKEAVFNQYAAGIQDFIKRSRENNIVPIVGLCYPRMVYTPVEYEYVRRMNLLTNSWDVPSVNLLGATDDGTGRYSPGFDYDDKHPNASGHRELFYAFVPSLLEALEKGKPTPSRSPADKGFARVRPGPAFVFSPEDTMHPFAISFEVRAQSDGTIVSISGSQLAAKRETKKAGSGQVEFESITLTPDQPFNATIAIEDGYLSYKPAGRAPVRSIRADSEWHHIVLSHYTALGETQFYVDGFLAGKVAERLQPTRFVFGGSDSAANVSSPRQADYRNLFVFRSALNNDEVRALHEGKVLQASLEIYAPLADASFRQGTPVDNRAQSMSTLKVASGRVAHVNDSTKPR